MQLRRQSTLDLREDEAAVGQKSNKNDLEMKCILYITLARLYQLALEPSAKDPTPRALLVVHQYGRHRNT